MINTWFNEGYRCERVHLCKRTGTAFVVPVLLQQPVPFAVRRPSLAILPPILGMLMLPAVLAVALVGPVIRIGGHFFALPLRFSGPLAGLVRTEPLGLGTGIRHKETPAMDTAHLAVHGFLLREAGHRKKNGFRRKNKNHNPKKMRKEIPVIEMREAEKNNYAVNFLSGTPGLLSHR